MFGVITSHLDNLRCNQKRTARHLHTRTVVGGVVPPYSPPPVLRLSCSPIINDTSTTQAKCTELAVVNLLNSPEFPFTLLNEKAELVLVKKFEEMLKARESISNIHPWLCDETVGQAILVCAVKQ